MTFMKAFAVCALVCFAVAANAQVKRIQGRTGFPKVWDGHDNVYVKKGVADLRVSRGNLIVEQNFTLQYPGGKVETGPHSQRVGIKEEFYRARQTSDRLTEADAKGFTRFGVWIDGRQVTAETDDWKVNREGDAVTRWRFWQMSFAPGQTRRMKIVTEAPMGWHGNKRYIQFFSKDLAGWRRKPDYLEVAIHLPQSSAASLAALEPRPQVFSDGVLRWIYRDSQPKRDVYILLPSTYAHRSR